MTDYYPLISQTVTELDAKATGEERRALYERARKAQVAHLRGVVPAMSESEITRERLKLEEAIRRVEKEATARARALTDALQNHRDKLALLADVIEREQDQARLNPLDGGAPPIEESPHLHQPLSDPFDG